jgi:hypothetical protein
MPDGSIRRAAQRDQERTTTPSEEGADGLRWRPEQPLERRNGRRELSATGGAEHAEHHLRLRLRLWNTVAREPLCPLVVVSYDPADAASREFGEDAGDITGGYEGQLQIGGKDAADHAVALDLLRLEQDVVHERRHRQRAKMGAGIAQEILHSERRRDVTGVLLRAGSTERAKREWQAERALRLTLPPR